MVNQFLALSLFVMLLSFFIIMNAMSNFEELMSRPVMDSISLAFSTKPSEESLNPSYIPDPSEAFQEGDTLEKIDALFRSQITGVEVRRNRLGTVMHMQMPLKKFEKAIMGGGPGEPDSAVQSIDGPLLPTLASLLQSEGAIPHHMDMILTIKDNPARAINETPENILPNIERVAMYAKQLENIGLPRKLVTAGVGQGEAGMIDLYFRRYEPFNPLEGQGPASKPAAPEDRPAPLTEEGAL